MTVNEGGPEGHTPPLTEGPSLPNTESGTRGHDAGVVLQELLLCAPWSPPSSGRLSANWAMNLKVPPFEQKD